MKLIKIHPPWTCNKSYDEDSRYNIGANSEKRIPLFFSHFDSPQPHYLETEPQTSESSFPLPSLQRALLVPSTSSTFYEVVTIEKLPPETSAHGQILTKLVTDNRQKTYVNA